MADSTLNNRRTAHGNAEWLGASKLLGSTVGPSELDVSLSTLQLNLAGAGAHWAWSRAIIRRRPYNADRIQSELYVSCIRGWRRATQVCTIGE